MGNSDEIKDRLRRVLEVKNMSVSKFVEDVDIKRSTLSAQINGSSTVSADTIKIFLQKFGNLSAEWLLRGNGEMFCHCPGNGEEIINTGIIQTTNEGDNVVMGDAVLAKENEMLKKQIEDKDREIEFLRGVINK